MELDEVLKKEWSAYEVSNKGWSVDEVPGGDWAGLYIFLVG